MNRVADEHTPALRATPLKRGFQAAGAHADVPSGEGRPKGGVCRSLEDRVSP
jgi:hypothetical protein